MWQMESSNRQVGTFTCTPVCGRYNDLLAINEAKSTRIRVVSATDYVYVVLHEDRRYIIFLDKKTCTCHRFKIGEIPRAYAYVVLKRKHFEPDDYCFDLYKSVAVLGTYQIPILSLPDRSAWETYGAKLFCHQSTNVFPGRPRKKEREKFAGEFYKTKSTNSCSACGIIGHNRRSCRKVRRVE
ncbi:uncharacterized protein LOC124898048 [Capsicum annuum]|uniref:uncharacterized protein LOC124898048 n=1 Tax=Capsicum annuum TaxID=4072 RepID=UPI001FB0FFD0|nr:uncharacterized protein LOC124898048 [Capsicum annuum]